MREKEKYNREILDLIRSMQNIDFITPEDIPNIDLYMDQVTTFMDEHLVSSKRFDDDKILTKTMINNYTKNNLLPPPNKKKYSKEHMLLLIYIYYFKNFLAINDIKDILDPVSNLFFDGNGSKKMDDIYSDIVNLILENMDSQLRDIIRKSNKSNKLYSELSDEDEKKTLSKFAFICMLSFDVWVKKTIIENLVDDTLGKKKKYCFVKLLKQKSQKKQINRLKNSKNICDNIYHRCFLEFNFMCSLYFITRVQHSSQSALRSASGGLSLFKF